MKRSITRRTLLRGIAGTTMGLPALHSMFNGNGTAWAAPGQKKTALPIEKRFVLWFNGNGIPEKYWIPTETGAAFGLTPCLAPLAPLRDRVHVITGLDNMAVKLGGPGNGHTNAMAALMTCTRFSGRGASGRSFDQAVAEKLSTWGGQASRFRSLEMGVANESFGESMQRNMSWIGANRPLPPEMLPSRLFDRLFGQKDLGWIARQKSVIDTIRADAADIKTNLGKIDQDRLEEHLASVRDLERAITSLPPEYKNANPADYEGDQKDWSRVARLQSDLLTQAFATRQTRVASYMLTKCQSLTRFPWLGHTTLRHHDYTHSDRVPGSNQPAAQALRDICRWHVAEFAYLLAKLRATPEGAGTVLDHSLLLFVHEHAEAGPHKNTGHAMILAGGLGGLRTGLHTRATGNVGDLYLTVANQGLDVGLPSFPTATQTIQDLFT